MNESESQNSMNLANARKNIGQSDRPVGKVEIALSFGKKLSKHWVIILVAVIFDVFALIPIVAVLFNLTFALILFLYFGSKKKKGGSSNLVGIVLPEVIGSALDWIISVIPVNIGTALIRIFLSDDPVEENYNKKTA